jgi:hypothetical protein
MMTTPQNTSGHTGDTGPVACTLTSADLTAQVGRWTQLIARAMTGRAETPDGVRVSFRSEAGAEEELRALVAAENECCSWAAWTVDTSTGTTVLEVRSAGDGVATLRSMFGLAPASS